QEWLGDADQLAPGVCDLVQHRFLMDEVASKAGEFEDHDGIRAAVTHRLKHGVELRSVGTPTFGIRLHERADQSPAVTLDVLSADALLRFQRQRIILIPRQGLAHVNDCPCFLLTHASPRDPPGLHSWLSICRIRTDVLKNWVAGGDMASKLYEGRVALVDTETGEMILVGCLIAINGDDATFTIAPTSGDEGHAIVRA